MHFPQTTTSRLKRHGLPGSALFAVLFLLLFAAAMMPGPAHAWTLSDLSPWKQIREARIFSLTRADPIGVRILVVPVIDDPVNAPIVTRISTEFSNSLRSFASEVWLVTDLPDNPLKQGFYTALPNILADYRLRNCLSMDLLKQMIPDFECDFVALLEVTNYDRYWIDEDLQHRVGLRAVMYDYEDGYPRLEKYYQGGRGRRLEEGAFSEAERIAVRGLVELLENPLRESVRLREEELQRRYQEIQILAGNVSQQQMAIHQHDLNLMIGEIQKARGAQLEAERLARTQAYQLDTLQREVDLLKGVESEDGLAEPAVAPPVNPAFPSSDCLDCPAGYPSAPPNRLPRLLPRQSSAAPPIPPARPNTLGAAPPRNPAPQPATVTGKSAKDIWSDWEYADK